MFQYVNGIGKSHVKITSFGNAPSDLFNSDLPYCKIEGHLEEWNEISITHELVNFDTVSPVSSQSKKVFGYYPVWTLDWSSIILKASDIYKITNLINLQSSGNIFFTPRTDYMGADGIFRVIITSTNFGIIKPNGKNPSGNKGIKIVFKGTDMVSEINIRQTFPPDVPDTIVTGGSGTPFEGEKQ